jgi:hypothetical protein
MRSAAFFCTILIAGTFALGACGSRSDENDNGVKPNPNPIGTGVHIRDVVNPANNMNGATVNVSGAVVLTVDTYDETANGKSAGTVYVQDIGSQAPFSGASLYSPSFVPSDLRVVPGDTLDLLGQYVIESSIGTAVFSAGQGLAQISKPTATFRYEYETPAPLVIDVNDLDDYNKGFQWENMLVTVQNVTVYDGLTNSSGRVTGHITPDFTSNQDSPEISNELMPLPLGSIAVGQQFKSITGIVTWFFNYHIAPRSQADLVPAN